MDPPPLKKKHLNEKQSFNNQSSFQTNTNESKQENISFSNNKNSRMVWVDCEMSGLNIDIHKLCEIAVIITDEHLNIIHETPNIAIHLSDKDLDLMSDWCKQNLQPQLISAIKTSTTSVECAEAEQQILAILEKYIAKGKSPLCGNSVHVDRRFIAKEMPLFDKWLHYRIIDVSSIKELSKRWFPVKHKQMPSKKFAHRALDDIRESIEELKWYRSHIFQPVENNNCGRKRVYKN